MKFQAYKKNETKGPKDRNFKFKKIYKPYKKFGRKNQEVPNLARQLQSQMDGFLYKCCLKQFKILSEASISNLLSSKKCLFKEPFSEQIFTILRVAKLSNLFNKVKNKKFDDLIIIDKKMVAIQMQNRSNAGGISIQTFGLSTFDNITKIAMFNTAKIYKAKLFQLTCTGEDYIYCLLQMQKIILAILLTSGGFKENTIWSQKKFFEIYDGEECLVGCQIVQNFVYVCNKQRIIVLQIKASKQDTSVAIVSQKKAFFSLGKHEIIRYTKTQKGLVVATKDFYLYYIQGAKIFRKFRTGIAFQNIFYVGHDRSKKYFLIKDKEIVKFVIICFTDQVNSRSYEISNLSGQILSSNYVNQQTYILIKSSQNVPQTHLYILNFQSKEQKISLYEVGQVQCLSAYRIINQFVQKSNRQNRLTINF